MHRNYIKSFLITALLSLLSSGLIQAQPTSKHFKIEKISEGVWAAVHKFGGYAICNAGIIDLGDQTLIFDTFISPEAARELKHVANELTSSPIKYVVNGHYHNDHIRGNQVFYPEVDIISTVQIRNLIMEKEQKQIAIDKKQVPESLEEYKKAYQEANDEESRQRALMWLGYYQAIEESFHELKTIMPNLVFEEKMIIHGKNMRVELIAFENGHTYNDLILYLPEKKILFSGDLVFNLIHPWLGNSDPGNWIKILDEMKSLQPAHVVPGHGNIGNATCIDSMQAYIRTIDEYAKKLLADKVPLEEIPKQPVPDNLKGWYLEKFFAYNLQFMYKQAAGKSQK